MVGKARMTIVLSSAPIRVPNIRIERIIFCPVSTVIYEYMHINEASDEYWKYEKSGK
jgi:hypothetical protein